MMRKFTRREFLQLSAVTAAGTVLATRVPTVTAQSPTPAPDDRGPRRGNGRAQSHDV